MLDLVLRGGRVMDPAAGLDARLDVGFSQGRVAALAPAIDQPADETVDVSGCIVAPGFIDMHTHVYWGATSISIRGEEVARRAAVTTMVDAGSAGPANFPGFREYVIESSPRRILAFLNVAYPGIFAYSKPVMVGECSNLQLLDPVECVRTVEEHRDLIVGIKVRIGRIASGNHGVIPLEMALEVGEETGLPVMVHIDHPPPSRREVLSLMRPGDILTHCCKPFPNSIVRGSGEIWDEVRLARERGVVFDLGHGGSSFGFDVARALLDKGFLPDVLSTDIHVLNVDGPVYDLMTTMCKFMTLGVPLQDVLRCVTSAPARALGRPDLGTLAAGSLGDATVFRVEEGEFRYRDCFGKELDSPVSLRPRGAVCSGRWLAS